MNLQKYLPVLFFLVLGIINLSCQFNSDSGIKESSGFKYDSLKAQKYGADAYGMKKYVVAFLKRGSNKSINDDDALKLQKAHLENIQRMAREGKLVLAGPFLDTGDLRGIYIFNVSTIEEAEELTATDPAIKAGTLTMDLKEWYGSAALMEVNDIHKKLERKSITE